MHLRPLVPAVRDGQRIATGVREASDARAGVLADGAAPLQLYLGEVALKPGAGEYSLVDSAEREVDDRRQVGVVAALKVLECFVRKWESENKAERSCQAGAGVGERLQHRSDLL